MADRDGSNSGISSQQRNDGNLLEFLQQFAEEQRESQRRLEERIDSSLQEQRESQRRLEERIERIGSSLQNVLASRADPWATSSVSKYSREDSESLKEAAIEYYGLPGGEQTKFCQVLGEVDFYRVSVINAHIWPRRAAVDLTLFDLKESDIHSEKNVLRLQRDIEKAFDKKDLTFVESNGDWVVKVLNPSILPQTLKGTGKTFKDIEGNRLLLLNDQSPYRRLLAHHSVISHRNARTQGWINQDLSAAELNVQDMLAHSLDKQAQARLKLLWRNPERESEAP